MTTTDKTLELAKELIRRPSVTPRDEGCQELIAARLAPLGFTVEHLRYGDVDNLWLRRGTGAPLVVFAGHTDVVPPGPLDAWQTDPFTPTVRDGYLYGRGAADMKGSIAAIVTAVEDFVGRHPDHPGSIALLVTSDEEGPSVNGTAKVMEWLKDRGVTIQYCLVAEPSSREILGDVIKIGRRGSLNARLTIHGIQGHAAYPQLARNPIHAIAPVLAELTDTVWDQGNADFPPTSFQISNIHAGTGAENVIPGTLELACNFRYSTATTDIELRNRLENILKRHEIDYSAHWHLSGRPFLTRDSRLTAATRRAIKDTLGIEARSSTDGGTSDGRFIAPTGADVIELGPVNATIHKIDERIAVADLPRLSAVYANVIDILLFNRS